MALTTEKIYAAADQLHADGVVPTQTKLREALGGGSFSTIGEALKSWKQAQQENEQLKRSDMPGAPLKQVYEVTTGVNCISDLLILPHLPRIY